MAGNGRTFSQPGAISSGFKNKLAPIKATRVAGDLDGTPEIRHLIDELFHQDVAKAIRDRKELSGEYAPPQSFAPKLSFQRRFVTTMPRLRRSHQSGRSRVLQASRARTSCA